MLEILRPKKHPQNCSLIWRRKEFLCSLPVNKLEEICKNITNIAKDYYYLLAAVGGSNSIPMNFHWEVDCQVKSDGTCIRDSKDSNIWLQNSRHTKPN